MDALLGQMIGRYQVQQLLSVGHWGNVYQGVDVNLDRPVALKVLAAALTGQAEFGTKFTPLARTAVRLSDAGVVRVYDFGQAADQSFVAMELLTGPTLAQLLARLRSTQQWIVPEEARQLVLHIGQTVAAVQEQGAQRRLPVPSKIMFREGTPVTYQALPYQPVSIDLGLLALFTDTGAAPRWLPPALLAYLAPELLLRARGDARSEIYMLGALFYELLLGQPPLQAETVGQAIDAHLQQTSPLPQTLAPDLPVAVADWLQQALAYTPTERFLTLSEQLDKLAALPDLTALAPPAQATAGTVSLASCLPHKATGGPPTPVQPLRVSALPQADRASRATTPVPPAAAADLALPTLTLAPHLQVIAPDGTIQWVELTMPTLTIGRVAENDLILDDPRVSRRHARLEVSGQNWQVVDLQSANGTFLGKQRIPTGQGVAWSEEQPLQIGNYRLRLVREQVGLITASAGSPPPARTAVYLAVLRREIERSQIQTSADGGIGLYLVERSGALEPGTPLAFTLILLNQRAGAETVFLKFTGVPVEWVQPVAPRYDLQAGEQRQVLLTLTAPRSPQTRPARYALHLEINSQRAPEQQAHSEIELTVKPFVRFRAAAQAAVSQVGEVLQIQIENQGNAQQSFALQWADEPPGELDFTPPQANLQIPPGMTGLVELNSTLRKQRWLGGPREHLLQIQVATPNHPAQRLVVKLISHGWLH